MKHIPKHLAIIPDGNRRWAKERGLPTLEGHRRGFDAVSKIATHARKRGVEIFTIWAFSTENWNRSKTEVTYLMNIYEVWLKDNLAKALRDKIRIVHIGRKDKIPVSLKTKLAEAEQKTAQFTKDFLVLALDYGGRDEILRAVHGLKNPEEIVTEEDFAKHLDTKDLPYPNPDLVIRTSGERRLSGFMSWQTAYSEYIFVDTYLPDFTPDEFDRCLEEYGRRQRRFGK